MSTENLVDRIAEVIKRAPENRHSYFQLKYFVLGKEHTRQGQLWACLRELRARYESLLALRLEKENTKDQIELLAIKEQQDRRVIDEEGPWSVRGKALAEAEYAIKCRQYDRQKVALQLALEQLEEKEKYTLQEARFFVEAFEKLEAEEPLKDFDDFDAQKEYWNDRIAQKLTLKLLLHNTIDSELAETALALPENTSVRLQVENTLKQLEHQLRQLGEQNRKLALKGENGPPYNKS